MAEKLELIVISPFRITAEHQATLGLDQSENDYPHHVPKGLQFPVLRDAKTNKKLEALLATLYANGRIAGASEEMVKQVKTELANEEKAAKAAKYATTSLPVGMPPNIAEIIQAEVAKALAAAKPAK